MCLGKDVANVFWVRFVMDEHSFYLRDVFVCPLAYFCEWVLNHEVKFAVNLQRFFHVFWFGPGGVGNKDSISNIDLNKRHEHFNSSCLCDEGFFVVNKKCRNDFDHT